MTDEEKINKLNRRSEFNLHNNIFITAVGDGTGMVETELTNNSMNPMGSAHGGLVYALCDVAAGVAAMGPNAGGVTQSGSLYYLRPAVGKKLRAVGTVIKKGRTVSLVQTDVFDDANALVARGEFEYFHTDSHAARDE
jgi:acyl-CoA thioesterase